MSYAVHSLHAPAVKLPHTLDGKTEIPLPEPLHTAETMEAAEQWRLDQLAKVLSV